MVDEAMTSSPVDIAQESVTFGLEYDGPALANHEMNVRDLARALLSTGSLFQDLNREVNPTAPNVGVNVRANTEGSFLVELRLIFEIAEQAVFGDLNAGTLVGLISGVGGIIHYTKKRRSNREVSREPIANDNVRITYDDSTTLEIPASMLRAADSITIQRNLAEIVQPLDRDGVESVTLRRDEIVIASVNRDERSAFSGSSPSTAVVQLGVTEREVFLTIRNAQFETGRWGFTDGESKFTAAIRDESFLARQHSGEAFSELDVLRCRIRETQSRDSRGLHASVEIIEVLEHLPSAQGTLELGPA